MIVSKFAGYSLSRADYNQYWSVKIDDQFIEVR